MLIFIGLGLSIRHLTLEAIYWLNNVDKVIIDTYTGFTDGFDIDFIKNITCNKSVEIVLAERKDLESRAINDIIEEARFRNIAILVPGDPFIATTHDAIRVEALKSNVKVIVVNGLSIHTLAISRTGLQSYRFGKTVTLVYPDVSKPYSVVDVIYDNITRNLHTLVLLDYRSDENKYMSIPEAVNLLLDLDYKNLLDRIIGVGLARIGTIDEYIVADILPDLRDYQYPKPPHSLIIVAKPHPVELDCLKNICKLPDRLYRKYLSSKEYP
ncbi:MAG: diphthine synthase [Desulfurococcaceae archaeon]